LGAKAAQITIQKLKLTIKKYNINLEELFRKFDKSENQALEFTEFAKMMR
jgi:hypothetical protein